MIGILKNVTGLARLCVPKPIAVDSIGLVKHSLTDIVLGFTVIKRLGSTIWRMHKTGPLKPSTNKRTKALGGAPFLKGIVLKTLIKKPKKPNSANRKCVLVRLSNGKEMVAYVPGIGHNLQEHNVVLVREGRLRDTPGVKIKCVRGKYDLPHVVKPK